MKSKYLKVVTVPFPEGKTLRFNLENNNGVVLGRIQWLSTWRRYVFCPSGQTVFDPACLDDISNFLKSLMADRKTT